MKKYLQLNNEVLNTYSSTGKIDVEKDKLATKEYFLEDVNVRMRYFIDLEEKIKYLVGQDYYEGEFLKLYDFEFIKSMFKLAYGENFRFPSFMSASKFYSGYALKSRDGKEILEKYEDRIVIVALYLAQGDTKLAERAIKAMLNSFQTATPTFLNSGKKARGELVSCFPGEVKVKTKDGHIAIKNIVEGDLVLSHSGEYNKVLGVKVSKYEDELIKFNVVGSPKINISTTKEHPFLIHRPTVYQNKYPLNVVMSGDGDTENLKWVSAENITEKDYVSIPFKKIKETNITKIKVIDYLSEDLKSRVKLEDGKLYIKTVDVKNNRNKNSDVDLKSNYVNNELELNYELGLYIGYYLAEGYVHKNEGKVKGVRFTFNKKDIEFIEETKNLSESIFGITPSYNENKDNSVNVCSWSTILGDFFNNLLGTGFDKKSISILSEVMNKELAKGIVIGTYRGDGTTNGLNYSLDLVNEKLINEIRDLMFNLRVLTYRYEYLNNSGKMSYRLTIPFINYDNLNFVKLIVKDVNKIKNTTFSSSKCMWVDGHAMYRVKDITSEYEELNVYNLEVENDHTYTANEVLVHNCYKLTMDDNMNSIGKVITHCLELSRLAGGVGVLGTDIRPMGDPIKGILNRSSGIMPIAKLLENSFSYANQLGVRSGSGVLYLNIFHGDIEEFISAKKPNADEKIRLATLSTGVIIPDIFFELMEKNKDIVLFSPYDIYKEYGKRMSEISMTDMYYELLDNPNIRKLKRINARKLYTEIKKTQFESGFPFEMFDDNVNNNNPLNGLGRIKMSNLC